MSRYTARSTALDSMRDECPHHPKSDDLLPPERGCCPRSATERAYRRGVEQGMSMLWDRLSGLPDNRRYILAEKALVVAAEMRTDERWHDWYMDELLSRARDLMPSPE